MTRTPTGTSSSPGSCCRWTCARDTSCRQRRPPSALPVAGRPGRVPGAGGRPPLRHDGGSSYREQELQLEPGDRLVVVTDGLLERNAVAGQFRCRRRHGRDGRAAPARWCTVQGVCPGRDGGRARRRCRRPLHRLARRPARPRRAGSDWTREGDAQDVLLAEGHPPDRCRRSLALNCHHGSSWPSFRDLESRPVAL